MNDTTRKFPRTLDEAFGEGTSRQTEDEGDTPEDAEPPMAFDAVMSYFGAFLAGIGFLAACIAAGLYFGSLK